MRESWNKRNRKQKPKAEVGTNDKLLQPQIVVKFLEYFSPCSYKLVSIQKKMNQKNQKPPIF